MNAYMGFDDKYESRNASNGRVSELNDVRKPHFSHTDFFGQSVECAVKQTDIGEPFRIGPVAIDNQMQAVRLGPGFSFCRVRHTYL